MPLFYKMTQTGAKPKTKLRKLSLGKRFTLLSTVFKMIFDIVLKPVIG